MFIIVREVALTWLVSKGASLILAQSSENVLQAEGWGRGVQLVPVTHHSRDLGVGVGASCVVK